MPYILTIMDEDTGSMFVTVPVSNEEYPEVLDVLEKLGIMKDRDRRRARS